MPCKNCRDFNDNACTDITFSTCISWQGNADEELEICVGDSLTYVGNVVLDKIKNLIKGRGIILEDLTLDDCAYIQDILGAEEKNLLNVLNAYKQAICNLKDEQDLTAAEIASFAEVSLYTLECLVVEGECDDPATFKDLIQAIITKLCALSSQFDGIAENLLAAIEEGAGNFIIGGAIRSCGDNGISFSGTGASAVVTFEALVPPHCPILYIGSTVFFDTNGIGLPDTPYCGWFLCNGSNGTPNSSTLPQNLAGNLNYIIRFD